MDAEKMTITLDTEDMRTVLASVGFVVCDWKEKARDEKSGKMAHESAVRNAEMWEAIYQNILQQMKIRGSNPPPDTLTGRTAESDPIPTPRRGESNQKRGEKRE